MAKAAPKMSETGRSVTEFINNDTEPRRHKDAFALIDIMKKQSGFEPKMWGPSIIGFGKYRYRYESGREGDSPLVAFSPRKAALVIYLAYEFDGREELLSKLGKFKTSKACIYINKLADVDVSVLEEMIRQSIIHTSSQEGVK